MAGLQQLRKFGDGRIKARLAGQGGALHLPQSELSPQSLAHTLLPLTREGLLQMARQARALARPQAAAATAAAAVAAPQPDTR